VVGISTVAGNVPVEMGTRNALQVLELMQRDEIPVYVGAEAPLVRQAVHALEVHGEQGLGEARLPEPEILPAGSAIDFLIESINSRPGKAMVIATGPLTNLALAEKKKPGILNRARRVLAMGGTLREAGNITPVSEFNSFADPHACRQLIRAGVDMTLIPLDVTHRVGLEEATIQKLVSGKEDSVARFLEAATRTVIAFEKEHYGYAGIHLHDPAAIAMAIDPSLFEQETLWLDVETAGELTAGQMVVDRRPLGHKGERKGYPVQCAVGIEVEAFMEMFLHRLLGAHF
jgi:purine nucleosidase